MNAVPVNSPYITSFFFIDSDIGDSRFDYPSKAILKLQYNDLLGRIYEQEIFFRFREKDYDDMIDECIVEVPKYQGAFMY